MAKHTRAFLERKVIANQSSARHYAHLAMHYAVGHDDLRRDGNSMAYAYCAALAHKVMAHYLAQLLERGPRK